MRFSLSEVGNQTVSPPFFKPSLLLNRKHGVSSHKAHLLCCLPKTVLAKLEWKSAPWCRRAVNTHCVFFPPPTTRGSKEPTPHWKTYLNYHTMVRFMLFWKCFLTLCLRLTRLKASKMRRRRWETLFSEVTPHDWCCFRYRLDKEVTNPWLWRQTPKQSGTMRQNQVQELCQHSGLIGLIEMKE